MMTEVKGSGRWRAAGAALLRQAGRISWDLFKILVPITVAMRFCQQWGVIDWLGEKLSPVMTWVGLPGEMGLVWATALATNIYGAMVVFADVAPGAGLTVAQVTVLGTMVLVAHALPVELRIAQKAGARLRFMAVLRVGGALLLGWGLHQLYSRTGWLNRPNDAPWKPAPRDPSWLGWARQAAGNLLTIFLIILALLALMKLLDRLGVNRAVSALLAPVLRALGMTDRATNVTLIGMTLGITYGGGLIIQDARSGRMQHRDILFSLSLLGLCHSLIEDTLLLVALGAHTSGVLWARLGFALLGVFVLVRVVSRLPDRLVGRLFVRGLNAVPKAP